MKIGGEEVDLVIDRAFLKSFSDLVESYNEQLYANQQDDQLNIHGELAKIMDKITHYMEKQHMLATESTH